MKTDVTALGRYVAADLAKDTCHPISKDPNDPDGHYAKQACAILTSLQTVADLRSLLQGINQFNSLALDYTNADIARLTQLIAQTDPQKSKGYQYQLENDQREEAVFQRTGEELTHALASTSGNEVFDLHLSSIDLPGYGSLVGTEVYLDKGEARVTLSFQSEKIADIDSYFQMKPVAEQYLIGLQNGDPKATQDVKDLASLMLSFVQGFVEPNGQ